MKQPLGIVALLYLGGLLLGNYFHLPLPCLFTVSLALAAGALLLSRLRPFLLWPLVILTGWTNFVWHTSVVSPMELRTVLTSKPEIATVRGVLVGTPTERAYEGDQGESFTALARLRITALQRGTNWQPVVGQIEVITPGIMPEEFCDKQEVQIYGVLGPPPGPLAEGLFDFQYYLRRQEVYFQLKTKSPDDWKILSSPKVSLPVSDRFKKWARPALALGRPGMDVTLHLEHALTLGEKTYLTDEVAEPFVQAATYHIFAVDGLRMCIIYGIFFWALRAVRLPRIACGAALIPLIWFYVKLTGWPPSAIRATIMLTIVIIGWTLKRPSDVLNSLFAAGLMILLWQPQQLFQAGFQLSFLVVLCILLITPRLDELVQRWLNPDPMLPNELRPRWVRMLQPPLRFVTGLFSTSLAAWIGSIPLVAYYFHILTPISAPANVVAVPLCGLVLASNLISLLLAGWFPAGAVVFNYVGWHLMEWIRVSSQWFANLPCAYAYVAAPTVFAIIVYYAILIAALTGWLFEKKRRAWRITASALLLAAAFGQWFYEHSAFTLTVLPLNGGNSVYCNFHSDNNDLLINCGTDNSVNIVMKPYLRAQGVNSLPCLALTHGDEQQVGGFDKLQSVMPIEKIVTSSVRFRSLAYRDIIQSLEKTPAKHQVVNFGDTFRNWTVLNPASTNHFPRGDDNALVLRGEFQGTRILFLSDLGTPGQQALFGRTNDLRANIVIAGLPGQDEPLNDALLDAIKPSLIVIADSELPATKKASRALRERLQRLGLPVLYTSEIGAVKISLRENRWEATGPDGLRLADGPVKNTAP